MKHEAIQIDSNRRVPPFLKWAGGKRWLMQMGLPQPTKFARLVEPFAGSAAVFFACQPKRAVLSDVNEELINLYRVIKNKPDRILILLSQHHEKHCADYYYDIRAKSYVDPAYRAARTLYLNRTCWNGLYRVNRRGEFNVPIGTKSAVLLPGEDFRLYAELLSNVELHCHDFEKTVDMSQEGDFLFVDPPYTVKHNFNGFIKYNETMFSWEDQVRLVAALRRAARRNVAIVVTNADHSSVREIYADGFTYSSFARQSVLAGSAAHRGATTEALFSINLDL